MRRWVVFAVVSLCCAVGAQLAVAERLPTTLRGDLERGGRVVIDISKGRSQGTPVERYRWKFRRISVRCSGERHTARGALTGGFAVNAQYGGPGDWGISGTGAAGPDGLIHATRVAGKLVSWKKARGWIRLWGSEIPLRGGGRAECDSGRLRWIARD